MHKMVVFALVLLGAATAACSAQPAIVAAPTTSAQPAIVAAPTITPPKLGTLRFSLNGPADVVDVPRLMALDALRAQGYTIEQTIYADQTLIADALLKGDLEFGSADTNLAWSAIAKGGDLRTIVGKTNTTTYLIANQNIQTCKDLNGRPITIGSSTTVANVMFQKYVKQNCPDVTPQLVVMNGSSNRVSALQTGVLVAARLEIVDWLALKRQVPDKFHILIDFSKEFPLIKFSAFSVQRAWAEQHPAAVKDFIRALLTAQRSVLSNPQLLRDGIVKYLSMDSARAQELADTYLALNVWDANGGLTRENVQYMLDFLISGSALPAGLKPEQVTDLSYLNAVLDEIGRK